LFRPAAPLSTLDLVRFGGSFGRPVSVGHRCITAPIAGKCGRGVSFLQLFGSTLQGRLTPQRGVSAAPSSA
jgi:hypothetical protein